MPTNPIVSRQPPSFAANMLDFDLPQELIAQVPLPKRDDARMLVLHRNSSSLEDRRITDLTSLLNSGDVLVLNNTRVLPAKLDARRKSGGLVPGLFVAEESPNRWRVLLEGSKRLKTGETLILRGPGTDGYIGLFLEVRLDAGEWFVRPMGHWKNIDVVQIAAAELLDICGETPLPPYVHRRGPTSDSLGTRTSAEESDLDLVDRARYQTVYARTPGAIAAPTAGLHFTETLLASLRNRGAITSYLTLHVGIGTFKPVTVDDLSLHHMHRERFEFPAETSSAVAIGRRDHRRIVAVGTTCVRVLEACASGILNRDFASQGGETDIFIYPPFEFRIVDAILTNFHLPRSTLLALVMAFAGVDLTREAYKHAIRNNYRFFSFGDAMLIL